MLNIKMSFELLFYFVGCRGGRHRRVPASGLFSQSRESLSLSLLHLPASSALWRVASALSPLPEGVVDKVERAVVARVSGLLPLGQPLHEVDLALVLARPRALPRAPAPGEGHVPALVARVAQRRVVVLQHDLGEDAVTTVSIVLNGGKHKKQG